MSDWPAIDRAANIVMQQAFGEPVAYQVVEGGVAAGDPVTITAIRHARVPGESGPLAPVEVISVNPVDLPRFPQRGDWVTAWGAQFVVALPRQPDPYGLVELPLMLRVAQS